MANKVGIYRSKSMFFCLSGEILLLCRQPFITSKWLCVSDWSKGACFSLLKGRIILHCFSGTKNPNLQILWHAIQKCKTKDETLCTIVEKNGISLPSKHGQLWWLHEGLSLICWGFYKFISPNMNFIIEIDINKTIRAIPIQISFLLGTQLGNLVWPLKS